jgi:protein arginine kinase activator
MICDVCKQYPATITIKKLVNNVYSEIHLCENCAKKEATNMGGKFDFSDFVKGVLDMENGGSSMVFPSQKFGPGPNSFPHYENPKCPGCGLTLSEFRRTAILGCEDCYKVFENFLEPIIKKMHGRTIHTGKVAHSSGVDILKKREITDIQQQLIKAIGDENYELAAEYRDMIKLLKTSEDSVEEEGSDNNE